MSIHLSDRAVISLTGSARFSFLQGIITQDIRLLENGDAPIIYSALLNPQGKIRFDFFLKSEGEELLMDVAENRASEAMKTLSLYKLRADVQISISDHWQVLADISSQKELGFITDPRLERLGSRRITLANSTNNITQTLADYHQHRVSLGVPDSIDLDSSKAYIAEYGIDHLNGVSFTKGCYVGQEVVARMRHRMELRKSLHLVKKSNENKHWPAADTIITANDKKVGELRSHARNFALAIVNHEKVKDTTSPLIAGEVEISSINAPQWFAK